MMTHCALCSQITGDRSGDLIASLLPDRPYVRRTIAMDGFSIVPSLGAIAEGHVLMCPNDHRMNFAILDEDQAPYARVLKASLKLELKRLYGRSVHVFEHGSSEYGSRVLCTVEHAHLHFIPTSVSVVDRLFGLPFIWREISTDLSSVKSLSRGDEYIYYESPDGEAWVTHGPPGTFESQIMRRMFLSALGREEEWNWRSSPRAAMADEIFRKLEGADLPNALSGHFSPGLSMNVEPTSYS